MSKRTMIGIREAKAQLSELVARAEAGEEVVLTVRGREVVRLVRMSNETTSNETTSQERPPTTLHQVEELKRVMQFEENDDMPEPYRAKKAVAMEPTWVRDEWSQG